jgi:hypothetical protein
MFESSHRKQVSHDISATISQTSARQAPPHDAEYAESFIELDSHADTSCVGANCRIIAYTDKVCSVTPYHPKYKTLTNVPIVQAGTAYEDRETGKTYILVPNQSRKFLKILEPFQPRKCHILRQFVNNQPCCRLIIWLIGDVSSQTQASYKLQEEVQCFDSI